MKINEEWKIDDNQYKCPYCDKIYSKQGICSHIILSHTEEGKVRLNRTLETLSKLKVRKSWNKGKTKETDERILKASETYKSKKYIPWNKGKTDIFSKETLDKISSKMREIAKLRVSSKGVGRAFKGWYKNYWCDSQWELAYLIYCLDHNIPIKRCEESFEYEYEGKKHLYHPDFIINENQYIEIKGYESNKDKVKFQAFPKNKQLLVYKYAQMKPIFQYVVLTYNLKNNNEIHLLYETSYKDYQKNERENELERKIHLRIDRIKNSNIDFSKLGWLEKISKMENISRTSIKKFMQKYMSDFYNKCYHRK